MATKGNGERYLFLRDNVGYDGPGCLMWPGPRNPNGYAMLGFEGRMYWAHRLMCELVNGPPPEGHEASHSCGNGKHGCVDPRHLTWKTKSQNGFDRRRHGTTTTNKYGPRGKIMPEQAAQIRALAGQMTQADLAARFGVSEPTIRDILKGKTHRTDRPRRAMTTDEEKKLRLLLQRRTPLPEIASNFGLPVSIIYRRVYRIRKKDAARA